MKPNALVLYYLMSVISFSCQEEDAIVALDPLTYDFRLMDQNGNISTAFDQGENFFFSFLIVNTSDQNYSMLQFMDDDFLRVYSDDNLRIDFGKPYKTIFCDYRLGVVIPARDTLKLEIPWQPSISQHYPHFCLLEDHSALAAGKYRTGFLQSFKVFNGNQYVTTQAVDFSIAFEIH